MPFKALEVAAARVIRMAAANAGPDTGTIVFIL